MKGTHQLVNLANLYLVLWIIAQGDLPEAMIQSTLKTLSQLYFTIENYAKALATIDRLIAAVSAPSPDVYMLKGQAHFQLQQYRQALEPIKTAIAKVSAACGKRGVWVIDRGGDRGELYDPLLAGGHSFRSTRRLQQSAGSRGGCDHHFQSRFPQLP